MIKPRPHRLFANKAISHQSMVVALWAGLASLESFIAGLWLISTPSDPSNYFLLGLSKSRWILLLGLLGALITFGLITSHVWRKTKAGGWITEHLVTLAGNKPFFGIAICGSLLGFLIISQIWYLASVVTDPFMQGYLVRLTPYFFLSTTLSAHTLLFLPLLRHGFPSWVRIFEGRILSYCAISFGVILVVCLVIGFTGIGITPDKIGWDAPGVPILPFQVGLVWGLGVLFLLFIINLKKKLSSPKGWQMIDFSISLLLWVSAVALWASEPLVPSFFNPEPRAPNFEYYPHSDAAFHDTTAQFLLIGDGFPGVARKPLYALFLAMLHGIAGQNYADIVFIQIVFIGLFPVLLYWLGLKIHHRVSGLIAAGLVILREGNALKLAGVIGVSNSKMLMSDLPATVLVVLITYLLVLWGKNPSKHRLLPLGIGGSVGMLLLLRPQSTFLIPAIFLLIMVVFIKRPLKGLGVLGILTIGITLSLTPWLIRSYQLIGKLSLNDPNQMAFLTQQYRLEPGSEIMQKTPGESEAEFIQRVNTYLKDFTRENPEVVLGFVGSHLAHNQVEMVQALPMSFWIVQNPDSELFPYWRIYWERLWEECCSVKSYVQRLGYWDPQREAIVGHQLFPMAVNLIVVSLGLGAIWIRRDITGWIPLGVCLVYSLSTAVGRYSGWRLILPADWVIFFYFSVGLGQVAIWFMTYGTGRRIPAISGEKGMNTWQLVSAFPEENVFQYRKAIFLGLVLLALGLLPTIIETVVPERYIDRPEQELMILASPFGEKLSEDFLRDGKTVVLQGRAMYPRFLKSGVGEPGGGWDAFSERDFDRVGFILLSSSHRYSVIMPLSASPRVLPNTSDVIVIGCQAGDYIDAAVIAFMDKDTDTIIRPSLIDFSCPLSVP